jgi:hypothetical protein
MTEADLVRIEKAARRSLGASCTETLALVAEVRRLRMVLENISEESAPATAAAIARAALDPPAQQESRA